DQLRGERAFDRSPRRDAPPESRDGPSGSGAVAGIADGRVADQSAHPDASRRTYPEAKSLSARNRTANLGGLSNVRQRRESLAASRQLSGTSGRAAGPAHVSHEHRTLAPREPGQLRSGLHRFQRIARTHGERFLDSPQSGDVSFALLQLV